MFSSSSSLNLSESEIVNELYADNVSSSEENEYEDETVHPTFENISEDSSDGDESDSISDSEDDNSGDNRALLNAIVWKDYDGADFEQFFYNVTGGYKPPSVNAPVSPLQFFQLFFTDELLQEIVVETNRYAAERINKAKPLKINSIWHSWQNVTLPEMKAFLGLLLAMGLNPKSCIDDYFSAKWVYRQPFFSNVFSRIRFLQIFWCFHVNLPEANPRNRSRADKVKNVVSYIVNQCSKYFTPLFENSVDESTIAFKGRVIFKTYNALKPTKWGLKAFVLSDSRTGYIYNFEPYFGKSTSEALIRPDLPFTSRIVVHLTNKLSTEYTGSGFHVFTDRYYTSPQLAIELKKQNIHLTGTVQQNRKGLPDGIKKSKLKLQKHETKAYRSSDDLLVSAWRDKRYVVMLSSFYNSEMEMVKRRGANGAEAQIRKPTVVCQYNEFMGGVDTADHYISSYSFLRKSIKWWRKMVFWLLEVAVVDSFLLHNMSNQDNGDQLVKYRKYREDLITGLVGDIRNTAIPKRKNPSDDLQRLNKKPHFLESLPHPKTRDCAVCSNRKRKGQRKETKYSGKTCEKKPGLCPARCFEMYHTLENFK